MLVTSQPSQSEWLNSMVVCPLSTLCPLSALGLSTGHKIYT